MAAVATPLVAAARTPDAVRASQPEEAHCAVQADDAPLLPAAEGEGEGEAAERLPAAATPVAASRAEVAGAIHNSDPAAEEAAAEEGAVVAAIHNSEPLAAAAELPPPPSLGRAPRNTDTLFSKAEHLSRTAGKPS